MEYPYTILVPEIRDDPLQRGYASMSGDEITADFNTAYREVDVETVTGQQIFEAVTPADYVALSADHRSLFHAIIGMGEILVNGTNTKAALLTMFGPGTVTRVNLAALQKRPATRAEELGLGVVGDGTVTSALGMI